MTMVGMVDIGGNVDVERCTCRDPQSVDCLERLISPYVEAVDNVLAYLDTARYVGATPLGDGLFRYVPWPLHVTAIARRMARNYSLKRLVVIEGSLRRRSARCHSHRLRWQLLIDQIMNVEKACGVKTGRSWAKATVVFGLFILFSTLTMMGASWTDAAGAVGAAASKNPGTFLADLGHMWSSLRVVGGASDALFMGGIVAGVILLWHAWSWRTVRLVMNHYPARPGRRSGVTRRWQHIRRDGVFLLEDAVFAAAEARSPVEVPWDLFPRFAFLTGLLGSAMLSSLGAPGGSGLFGPPMSSAVVCLLIGWVVVLVFRRRMISARGSMFDLPDRLVVPARILGLGGGSVVSVVLDKDGVSVLNGAGAKFGPWRMDAVAIDRPRMIVRFGFVEKDQLSLVLRRFHGEPFIGVLLVGLGGLLLGTVPIHASVLLVLGIFCVARRWVCRREVRDARVNLARIESWLHRNPVAGDITEPTRASPVSGVM
jgi:hypothetical protein